MNPQNRDPGHAAFLLEIGSEEIPARFIPDSVSELETRLVGALREAHLAVDGVRVLATPRRLALLIERLALAQPDREVEIKGPPVDGGLRRGGQPTPAAEGFARKAGVPLAECGRGSDERGEFLLAKRLEPGRPAAEVLASRCRRPCWASPSARPCAGATGTWSIRAPLQWIVALLGTEVVPLAVGDLQADRVSRGHRTLAGDRPVPIAAPDRYVEALRGAGVIVDQAERRQRIVRGHAELVAAWDPAACLLEDEELLTEVVHLCEHPTPFLGSYADEYAALPAAGDHHGAQGPPALLQRGLAREAGPGSALRGGPRRWPRPPGERGAGQRTGAAGPPGRRPVLLDLRPEEDPRRAGGHARQRDLARGLRHGSGQDRAPGSAGGPAVDRRPGRRGLRRRSWPGPPSSARATWSAR